MTKEIKNGEKIIYIMERYFKWIALILFIVVLTIGYFVVLKDKYDAYMESKNITLAGMEESIKNAASDKIAMQNIKKANISTDEENLLYMAVPKTFDFNSIVSQLTALSSAYNFSVNNIEVAKGDETEDAVSGQNIKSARISMSISGGNYEEFKRFLSAIETSSMIFDVLSVNFSAGQSYDLVIKSYYLN
jgi:Tfp pilus assembly protein PilO